MTTRGDDGFDEVGENDDVPSLTDVVRRWRYTLAPTLYTDEDSSTDDLLWQKVLELRAIRGWLVLVLLGTLLVTITLVLVATGVIGP